MGLLKGTWTFSRFQVVDPLPKNFLDFAGRQLKKFGFRELSAGGEEKSSGWTSLENVLDGNFEYASYALGDYLVFSLRLDRKSVPPALLKIRVLEAEKKTLAARGKKILSKTDREQIRERVHLDLLSQSHPVPSFFDVCWSLSRNSVWFGSLSPKVIEEFQVLFKKAFNLSLTPLLPWEPSGMERALAEKITSLKDGVFLSPPEENGGESGAPLLGREFLTWVWYKSEERGGGIEIPGAGDMEVALARRLVLESGGGEYCENVVCQGLRAGLKEGKTALREGKKVKEARIRLGAGDDDFEFTLKADSFQFQSLRLPEGMGLDEEGEEKGGRTLERIYLMERATGAMDQLFSHFLGIRTSPQWSSQEIPRIRKWLQK